MRLVPELISLMATQAHWKTAPEEHDYAAAASYLALILPPAMAQRVARKLRKRSPEHYRAKDILRASAVELLDVSNAHVAQDIEKVRSGEFLSPVLLVRGDVMRGIDLTIADGYHRVCAGHYLDEDSEIPCHIVDLPAQR